ncbi:MAG: alcohol dehydrogenase [Cereibacter sphaeroides]|uniref:Alcohol dehydrogenase n=1 Tax=Cereibacter sphaeroides TaxID=1063 RepID=A0A2W5S1D6_CERSP|nr:MAG: alcohol dehydrogenase [Cereibacter sphaeroides]
MTKRALGQSGISIEPFVLGTNVFGWTADEATSFAVMDAFTAEGFSAIDTADVYSRWVPGNDSESERIIGRWMKARGNRDKIVLMTKVGSDMGQGRTDLRASWIEKAVEDSLRRLQTDFIDLYQTHWPDPQTPEEETLGAYDKLIKAGKVRAIGASNYDEKLLTHALDLSREKGLPRYQAVQNEYNLYAREKYEGPVQEIVLREGMAAIPYYSLASGFLTGKYRSKADLSKSQRGEDVAAYLDARGMRILAALDQVSASVGAAPAEVALAWINAQPGIVGPLASATSVAQLESLARGARLHLSADQIALLTKAGN